MDEVCVAGSNKCANSVGCSSPTYVKKCIRGNVQSAACSADSDCGPGLFCSGDVCKKIFVDTGYPATPTSAFECSSGHFHNSACLTVTVSSTSGGTALAYPYKCSTNCYYTGGHTSIACSNTNGYCPIKPGMAEYTSYYVDLAAFYASA